MSSTFFALSGDQVYTDAQPYEMNVNSSNAYAIMKALGMRVDTRDHPAGDMPVGEFLQRVEACITATVDGSDLLDYMMRLRRLAWAARQADTIAWG